MNKLVFFGDRQRIGEILVGGGKVEPMQLERALSHQDTVSSKIGEILVTLGYLSEEDVIAALAEQFSVELYQPEDDDEFVIPEVAELFHRNHQFALIRRSGDVDEESDGGTDPAYNEVGDVAGAMGKRILLVSDPTDGNLFAALDVVSPGDYEIQLGPEAILKKIMAEEYGLATQEAGAEDLLIDESDVDRLKDMASEAPVIKYVNSLIDTAVSRRASDIHLEAQEEGLLARFRVDGILQDYESPPHNLQAAIISRVKLMAALDIAERRLPQDGKIGMRISGKEIDLRVSTLPTVHGEGIVIRILEKGSVILDMSHLGMQADTEGSFRKLLKIQDGIILVTGPTGSGKTTTLYCAMNQISNETNKIITIEDPVEYQLKGINQIQVRPEIDLTFAKGLRSIVRQDPDVIMIGEIRDLETAEIAVQSSLTGHLVFSTLHTNDAVSAVVRMVDLGIERFLLVSSLRGVLAQRLVRMICPHCKEDKGMASEILGKMPAGKDFQLFEGRGCSRCGNSGYSGRIGLYEFLVVDETLSRVISKGGDLVELKKVAMEGGFRTMHDDGMEKVRSGMTTLAEVIRVAGG